MKNLTALSTSSLASVSTKAKFDFSSDSRKLFKEIVSSCGGNFWNDGVNDTFFSLQGEDGNMVGVTVILRQEEIVEKVKEYMKLYVGLFSMSNKARYNEEGELQNFHYKDARGNDVIQLCDGRNKSSFVTIRKGSELCNTKDKVILFIAY